MKDESVNVLERFKEHLLDPDQHKSTKKYVLGCLQLLTTDIDNGLILITNGWFHVLFKMYDMRPVLARYFVVLILSNMLLFAEKYNFKSEQFDLDSHEARRIISEFIYENTPLFISEKEGKTTSWQSVKPFAHFLQSNDELLFSVGTFAMAQLTYRKLNRELVVKEGMVEVLMCCQWSCCQDWRHKEWERIIIKNIEREGFVPSLEALTFFKLRQAGKVSHQQFTDYFHFYVQYEQVL